MIADRTEKIERRTPSNDPRIDRPAVRDVETIEPVAWLNSRAPCFAPRESMLAAMPVSIIFGIPLGYDP